jgi:hypothetical protein
MDALLNVAYDIAGGTPWWAWVALLTMIVWGLLAPAPGDG